MSVFSDFKRKVESELRERGLWDDFLRVREGYKANGIGPQDAWRRAYEEVKGIEPTGQKFNWMKESSEGFKSALGVLAKQDTPKSTPDLYHRIKHKTATPATVMHWVFNHAGLDLADIDPDSIPSPGALRLLEQVQSSHASYDTFFNAYTKLLPSRTQLDAEARFQDDGREVFLRLAELEEELDADRPEGLGPEHPVPPPPAGTVPEGQGSPEGSLDRGVA